MRLDLKLPDLEDTSGNAKMDEPRYDADAILLRGYSLCLESCKRGMDGAPRL